MAVLRLIKSLRHLELPQSHNFAKPSDATADNIDI